MQELHLRDFERRLPHSKMCGDRVYFKRPGCKSKRRACSLKIKDDRSWFIVKDHHRDAWHWRDLEAYVCRECGLDGWKPRGRDPEAIKRKRQRENIKRKKLRAIRAQLRPLSLSQRRPWERLGVSQRTWYRRGLHRVAEKMPTLTKFRRPILQTSKHGTRNTETATPKHGNSELELSCASPKRHIFPLDIITGVTAMAKRRRVGALRRSTRQRRRQQPTACSAGKAEPRQHAPSAGQRSGHSIEELLALDDIELGLVIHDEDACKDAGDEILREISRRADEAVALARRLGRRRERNFARARNQTKGVRQSCA